MSIESVAVLILWASNIARCRLRVNLKDGVFRPVDIGINTHAEQMLMIVCVDTWVNLSAPAMGILSRVHGVGVQDACEFDFKLDSAVLVEDPVDAILIICSREDVRDQELPPTSHNHRVIAEVGVFE